MSWPKGVSRSGDRRFRPLEILTPTLRRCLHAAESVEAAGRQVTAGELAWWLGVHRTAVVRARQRLLRLGLWRWDCGRAEIVAERMRRTEAKVARAAEGLEADGLPVAISRLARRSLVSRKGVRLAVGRMKAKGEWRWKIVSGNVGRVVMPLAAREPAPGPGPRDPSPAEIALACRAILVGKVGFSDEEADRRVVVRMARATG